MEQTNNNFEEKEEIKWGGLLNEFLWWCAGVNKKILRQCPADYSRYAGSGGTILFTALMAMLSGGYAMYFVFHSPNKAIAFGVFWGLLIFNLDRYIYNSMYTDGLPTKFWDKVRPGLPRIILAIFIGVVISTPLEMKIFEERINSQLVIERNQRINDAKKLGDEGNKADKEEIRIIDSIINQVKVERKELDSLKNEIVRKLDSANMDLKLEVEGKALSGKIGCGPIYKEKLKYRDYLQARLDNWNDEHKADYERTDTVLMLLNKQKVHLQSKVNEMSDRIESESQEANEKDGFCARYEAFAIIKSENRSLKIVSIIIMMLFIVIEIVPTVFKMMMTSGEYDDKLREEMHRIKVMADKGISDINDYINTEIQISTEKNKNRLDAEINANQEVLNSIATAQAELLKAAIDAWREEELIKIQANPSDYIRTNMSEGDQETIL